MHAWILHHRRRLLLPIHPGTPREQSVRPRPNTDHKLRKENYVKTIAAAEAEKPKSQTRHPKRTKSLGPLRPVPVSHPSKHPLVLVTV